MRHIMLMTWFGLWLMFLTLGQASSLTRRSKRSVAAARLKTWPGGIVPYIIGIGTNKTEEDTWWFSDLDIKLILKAMKTIEQESCVRFIDASQNETWLSRSHIEIVGRNEKYCYAQLGVINDGRHELILNPLCRSFGQILHELLHALGLMHELMRPDRDDYIVVHEQNILPDYKEEFRRLSLHQAQMWNRDFDFQSVTLYDPFTFSANAKPVWEPRKTLADTPLFSLLEKDLSFEDAAAINLLYKCGAHCSERRSPCRPDEYFTKSCRCETSQSYAFRRCKDDRSYRAYCSRAIEQNKCYDETRMAVPFCRKTCGRCFRSGIFGRIAPPRKVCNDLDPNKCPNYVSEGYCYFDGWTRLNCQKSCGLCPPPRIAKRQVENLDARSYLAAYQEGKCLNRFDDLKCQVFADNGDCKKNPSFMSSHCALACNMCANKSLADLRYLKLNTAPCRNYIDDDRCDALAKEGKCRGITLKQCLASCNKCGNIYWEKRASLVTPAPKKSKLCRDQWNLCPYFVQLGDCEHKRQLMEQVCPKSCKFCPHKCQDFDPPEVCSDVARRGYCSKLGERCEKSCGLCTTTTERITDMSDTSHRVVKVGQRTRATESKVTRTESKTLQSLPILSPTRSREGNHQFTIRFQSPHTVSTMVIKDPPCHDSRPATVCRSWALSGYCSYSHVSSLCRETCTIC